MNTKILFIAIAITTGLFVTSCEKEEDNAKPEITLNELGYENSKIGYAGSEFHIEADIVAEGKIDVVSVEIHHEGEHEKGASSILHEDEWEFDSTFTEFSGLKNTEFHKHIEIPVYAEAGHYHFHFSVTDMEGQQTVVEDEIEVQLPTDDVAPVITVSVAPTENQVFTTDETITISGTVTDNVALGGIYIGLVGVDQALEDAQVNADNTITLLHTHDFTDPASYDFTGSIVVGAANDNDMTPDPVTWASGNYYLIVKSPDAFGGNVAFSSRYPIEITL